DERHAMANQPVDDLRRTGGDVVDGVMTLDLAHDGDRVLEEVRRVLAGPVRGERLVQMDVWLDEGRRGEVAGRVDFARGRTAEARLDALYAALGDPDVDEIGVAAQPRVADDHVHGLRSGSADRARGRRDPP